MNIFPVSTLNNNRNNNLPSFGMLYSPNTIKTLKKYIPDIINKEGFENTKIAIATLKKLGQRKDNIIINLSNDFFKGPWTLIETGVNRVKNRTFSNFIYNIHSPNNAGDALRSKSFKDFTKSFDTDEFVEAAHARINEYSDSIKNETFKEKVTRKTWETKEFFKDIGERIIDELSLVEGCTLPNGKKEKTTILAWEDLKDSVQDMIKSKKDSKNSDIALLRKEIDTLPTKL